MQSHCPKCRTPREASSTAPCAKCGLAAARMTDFAARRDADVADALKHQWGRTLDAWTDQNQHDELLRLVTQHDAFAWAAARYREEYERTPDDAIAAQQLERVRRAAEVTLLSTATRRPEATTNSYRSTRAVLAVLIVSAVALLIYGWLANRTPPSDPNEVSPAPAGVPQVR